MPFRMVNGVGPRNRVLDRRAHWQHLANTVERFGAAAMSVFSTMSTDAACSKITLGNLVYVHFKPSDVVTLQIFTYSLNKNVSL